jgi:hypothetical protein
MSIDPTNPPTYITNPDAAIPVQLTQHGDFVDSDNPLSVTISSEIPVNTVVTTLWMVTTQFVDGSTTIYVNDILSERQFYNSSYELEQTVWYDSTQSYTLLSPPPMGDIALISGDYLTNAQLRASPVPFTTTQLASSLGQKTMAASTSVTIASNQSTLPVSVMGDVNPATILSGQVTATGTATALASNVLANGIVITSAASNTAVVYVGPTGIDNTTGYALSPGGSISYGVANSNGVYIYGASGGTVFWTGN